MTKDIKCTCGHSWNKSDSSKKDMYICHICGKNNTMKDGGWLNKYNDGGPIQENYNDASASVGPDFVGLGYDTTGRNYSPAWGGQFQDGGILGQTFLQPNNPNLPVGWNPIEKGYSTEYSTTVGKDGEYYLVPGFKRGKLVSDPEKEFRNTGQLLGGPFKTIQSAQDFADKRHKYVEQGKPLPSPIKTYDYLKFQDGGKMTLPEAIVYGHKNPKVKDYFNKVRKVAEEYSDKYDMIVPIAEYHAMEQMYSEYGAPKINTIGEKDRPYYNPINDTINILTPKVDNYGESENEFLDELAHKIQANEKGRLSFMKDFVGKDLLNAAKNIKVSDMFNKIALRDAYQKNYTTPGTLEYEAHEVIKPKLNEQYRDISRKQYDRLSGEFAMGGSMPGAVGFTYARTAGSAPSNGKYAKKTKASAQDGAIIDSMGQWAHPGEITIIPSTDITMEGVDYPVLGISDTGDEQMMYPGEDYQFDGDYVTEYPMMKKGGWLNKYK